MSVASVLGTPPTPVPLTGSRALSVTAKPSGINTLACGSTNRGQAPKRQEPDPVTAKPDTTLPATG